MGVLLTCVSVYYVHVVPTEARRWHQNLWDWTNRGLLAAMWVLRTKPGSPARATNTLNHRAISPVCILHSKK